jgi:hypothetical protein
MPVTAAEIRQQIIDEIGDVEFDTGDTPADPSDGVVYQAMPLLWRKYAAKDRVAPGLRELYVKRAGIRMILGVLAQKRFDTADALAGATNKINQVWEHYQQMHEAIRDEIASILEQHAPGRRAYRVGAIEKQAPITTSRPPDPNAPRYGGTPFRGGRPW